MRDTRPGSGYARRVGRNLAESTVVITGASSGIGRAAALLFARRGAQLVLAARGADELAELARELGPRAIAVPTDVSDEQAVRTLADRAVECFGRLDVWVNSAGVMAYGRFDEVPGEVFRRVVDVNLFGQVHGARAALPHFRRQGSGVLINLASVWGRVTAPDVSAYVTSKFAVRAFSECLRQELRDLPEVDVATILPQAVDTPIFEAAANYSGRRVRPIPPLVEPEEVARGILRCAESPKPEVTYSRLGRLVELAHVAAPRLYDRLLPPAFEAGNYGDGRAPRDPGGATGSSSGARVRGGWNDVRRDELRRALMDSLRAIGRALRPQR
jgi:NAD(P)-dependent dehydrogenase (short-subunit alcohol dehydrogenase family)